MTSLTGEWLLQAELEEMARRPYTPPVTDPPGVPPLKSPRPTPEYPGGVPRDPPPITPPVKTASDRIGPDTILVPFVPKEPTTDDSYGDPHGTPEEIDELMEKGWAGLPAGGWEIPGKKKTGMGSLTPEEVDALIDANPGAEDLIRRKYQQEKKSVEGFPLAQNKKRDPLQELRDGLIDRDTFEKLRKTSPHLFKDTEEEGPVDISDWLVELNPAQIEALKGIPSNLKDLPDNKRLDTLRKITKKVKGLA